VTAATIPAAQTGARPRPVPWTRLAWVTWRQHRAALAGVTVLLGVAAVYLAVMGMKIHDAYATYAACRPAASAACQRLLQTLDSYYGGQHGSVLLSGINAQTVPFLLLVMPALIGVFTGAPVLARELESGTFRFAWTQGCGRLRWTAAKLVLLAVTLTAAALAFGLLFSWYFQPFIAAGKTSRFVIQVFGNSGVVFAAWTLLAFAMAAFLGAAIRRTVPAMAATLGIWTVLQVETVNQLRPYYEAPLTGTGTTWHGQPLWILGEGWTGPGGKHLASAPFQLAPHRVQIAANPAVITRWLGQHHFTQWFSYQPATRFWPFQLIEGGWVLALSTVLVTATLWLVRHRAA
jgi:ABC-2 family transporter protein